MFLLPWASVVAHRGDSAHFPENTLPALEAAIQAKAPMAEVDLALSQDGRLLVFHDETLDRITGAQGSIQAKSYQELRQLDAGAWKGPEFAGTLIPSFEELLDLAKGRIALNLEIKPETYKTGGDRVLGQMMEALNERDLTSSVLVSSFAADCLLSLRALAPQMALSLLSVSPLDAESWAMLRRLDAYAFHGDQAHAQEADAIALHQGGYRYLVYTVNQAERARELFKLGLHGVFSDDPRLLSGL
ncbi:MAG: glycerophosphodiester phosphodiesterase family protein [bacterium]|nr:glycerophosphodiester phosphodiesterase family protein [bacterium]